MVEIDRAAAHKALMDLYPESKKYSSAKQKAKKMSSDIKVTAPSELISDGFVQDAAKAKRLATKQSKEAAKEAKEDAKMAKVNEYLENARKKATGRDTPPEIVRPEKQAPG
jgi:hypothetical protein